VKIVHDFDEIFFEILTSELPDNFDLFYFSDMVKIPATQAGQNYSKNLFLVQGQNWGMYGYVISPKASRLLVKDAFPIANQIDSVRG
jgi:GR25 family glycosyltransferase involved in LPS biosynthesis